MRSPDRQDAQDQRLLLVTCTYPRPGRIYFIKECIKTFIQIPDMCWILVEDDHAIDDEIRALLDQSGISYVYLHLYSRSFGNAQKNLALTYIRDHHLQGVVYMADDDNRYDVRLFKEIRRTKKLSVFPVGNLGPKGIERPLVKEGRIIGWDADWLSRKFPIDQGGYAVNADLLKMLKDPVWSHLQYGGESEFIAKFIQSPDELEILCNECKECYVWHNDFKGPLGTAGGWNLMKNFIRRYFKIHIRRF